MSRRHRWTCAACMLATAALAFCAGCPPAPPLTPGKLPATSSLKTAEEPITAPAPIPDGLRNRVESAIDNVKQRQLRTDNAFWTVFHGILGLGPDITLLDPETKKTVKAVDYICAGGRLRGLEFFPTNDGLDVATMKEMYLSQGHQDQFIAEMTQWGMKPERKFVVNGKDYTFMDFIRHSKARASIKANQELSWAIIIIGQFFGTDCTWTNNLGEKLTFEDIVRYEMAQPVDDAACGGTHRLFGLSWVCQLHQKRGGQKSGVWKEVAEHLAGYQQRAKELQNPDGSFSTEFFRKRGNLDNMQQRIYSTGHTLEWLAFSLPDAYLEKAWVQDAVSALSRMILEIRSDPMESGAIYHAVHGLILYHARVWEKDKRDPLKDIVPFPAK